MSVLKATQGKLPAGMAKGKAASKPTSAAKAAAKRDKETVRVPERGAFRFGRIHAVGSSVSGGGPVLVSASCCRPDIAAAGANPTLAGATQARGAGQSGEPREEAGARPAVVGESRQSRAARAAAAAAQRA